MAKKLLITDTFFLTQKHIDQLESAGYEVTRLAETSATEDQLIEALQGVSVYIIGGVEQVTDTVINAVDKLEAIIFTGVDYAKFIPAAPLALEKGIKLLNAPGANAVGVAEFAVGVALAMQRQLFSVSRAGDKKHLTTRSIEGATIGIVGAGHIGSLICDAVRVFRPQDVLYFNRTSKDIHATQVDLDRLVEQSDIIFLTLPMSAGTVFDADVILRIKKDALLVSISPNNLIDYDALLKRLQAGDVRAAVDWPSPSEAFEALPLETWFSVNSHSAYNTSMAIENVNDSVTKTAIELLHR